MTKVIQIAKTIVTVSRYKSKFDKKNDDFITEISRNKGVWYRIVRPGCKRAGHSGDS